MKSKDAVTQPELVEESGPENEAEKWNIMISYTRRNDDSRMLAKDLDRTFRKNGLEDFLHKFKGKRSASISSVEFEHSDIQREDVVKEVLEIYSGDIPSIYNQSQDGDDNDNNSM